MFVAEASETRVLKCQVRTLFRCSGLNVDDQTLEIMVLLLFSDILIRCLLSPDITPVICLGLFFILLLAMLTKFFPFK